MNMDLIYYRGLNCHLAGIINITAGLGIDYLEAFSTLWSETDFNYDQKYHMYLSKRVFTNLELLGVEMEVLECTSPEIVQDSLSVVDDKELFLVGMDSFYIPWSPVYQHFHEPHYFFAKKKQNDTFLSFDPVYGKQEIIMTAEGICHAFELALVRQNGENVLKPDLIHEARQIQRGHPELRDKLLADIRACADAGEQDIKMLIRLITAMINNRYLFGEYLKLSLGGPEAVPGILDKKFFLKWEAVKHGLYKVQILKNKQNIISQAADLFRDVMEDEMVIANQLSDMF